MPGGPGGLALLTGVDHLGGAAGLPSDQSRIDLSHHRLFGAEASTNAELFHMDLGFWDVQGVGQDPPDVKNDLGGADNMEAAIGVDLCIGAEGLHHGLLAGLGVVDSLHHLVAAGQDPVHIPVLTGLAGTQVPAVVRPHRAQGPPALLRVDQDQVVLGGVEVQHRLQDLIPDPDALQRPVHRRLVLPGHDGHRVSHKADPPVQDEPVIGGGLRIGLSRHGEPLLWHILVGEDGGDAGDLLGVLRIDLLNEGVGVGAAQHFDHQAVLRGQVVQIGGPAQQEGHCVLFPHRLAHGAPILLCHHCASSAFLWFR